jgi:hypothetical protein
MRLYFKKINDLLKKWAKELNTAFSKEEVQMTKKHEMFNIPGHKESENQNHTNVPPHSC